MNTPANQNNHNAFPAPRGTGPLNVLVVGELARDSILYHSDLNTVADFKATRQDYIKETGGGGGNVAMNLNALIDAMGLNAEITLVTKIGTPADDYLVRDKVLTDLQACHNITEIIDLAEQLPHRVADNIIIAYGKGRFVSKDHLAQSFKWLSEGKGKPQTGTLHNTQILEKLVEKADIISLQSNDPDLASQITRLARQQGKPVVMDYSISDRTVAEKFDDILPDCFSILAPGEAVLSGENPNKLRTTLSKVFRESSMEKVEGLMSLVSHMATSLKGAVSKIQHSEPLRKSALNASLHMIKEKLSTAENFDNAKYLYNESVRRYPDVSLISISDGAKPVAIHALGEDSIYPIKKVDNVTCQLGTGDARTAALVADLLYKMQNNITLSQDSLQDSVAFASDVASLSVQYRAKSWHEALPAFILAQNRYAPARETPPAPQELTL